MPFTILKYNRQIADNCEAAVAIVVGQLIGLNSSGKAVLADADAGTPIAAIGVAVNDAAAGAQVTYVEDAKVEDKSLSLTPGDRLYTSGTAGAVTATRPTAGAALVQSVGYAISAVRVRLRISPSHTVVQAAGNSTVAFG